MIWRATWCLEECPASQPALPATARSPSFRRATLGPFLLEGCHFRSHPLRRKAAPGADRVHSRLDLAAHFVPPDFIAVTKQAQGFADDLAGRFVFAHGDFLTNELFHRLGQGNVHAGILAHASRNVKF